MSNKAPPVLLSWSSSLDSDSLVQVKSKVAWLFLLLVTDLSVLWPLQARTWA